ncbi:hypothetical protein UlMin_017413 [Ulmus minor]
MALIFSQPKMTILPLLLSLLWSFVPLSIPFTVIMPDSGGQSGLIEGPGYSMDKNGARTDPHEQEAVYDIMRATGNGWATDIPDVCRGRWHGIECMPDRDNVFHVVSLSFGALSDDTAFPTCDPTRSFISRSITKLPHIRTLFFYRCFTHNPQPIPSFLGQLGPSLQTLVLRENGHVGRIPSEVGNLTRLRVLDLHKNNLNGSIPGSLGRITALKSLDLSGNRLTGSIPGLSFPVLSIIDLSQNLLMGSIPASLSTCHSLIKIDFSFNRLTGSIPKSIDGLKDLMLMDLSYNRLSGPLPISLRSLVHLQALILKGNPMGSETISNYGFEGMKGLMILILSNMNLHGSIPSSLGQLPNLRVLHLDGNRLNGSIPTTFGELKQLSELRLNDNLLTGIIPLGREMVWKMRRKLKLYNNSGLCFSPNSDLEDYLDSSFNSGIGLCDPARPGSTITVQHLSTSETKVPNRADQSSSTACEISVFVKLLQIFISLVLVLF